MVTWLLSDAHLDGLDDPVQARLTAWLDSLQAGQVIFLGDLFHRWWHWGDEIFPDYAPVVEALCRLQRVGVAVRLLRGNHDFRLGALQQRGIEVHDHLDLTLAGARYHLAHGDEADGGLAYGLTRAFLRGPLFAALLARMSPPRAWRFLARLAGPPRTAGSVSPRLREAQHQLARARLRAGSQVVVLGHSHVSEQQTWPEGRYINLGAFRERGRVLRVDEAGPAFEELFPDGP